MGPAWWPPPRHPGVKPRTQRRHDFRPGRRRGAAGYVGVVCPPDAQRMTRTTLAIALAAALASAPALAQDPPRPAPQPAPQQQDEARDDDRRDNVELEQESLDRTGQDPAEAPLESARGLRQDANGDGEAAKWNVEATQGQAKTVRFSTSEGTWMDIRTTWFINPSFGRR